MLTVTSEPLGAPVLVMTDFQQHKRDDDQWNSPPVYTHHQGYEICLRVFANGIIIGEGTHVTVSVFFMRGEFDNSLKWPFRGVISYQLLDQVNANNHKTYTLTYDDKKPNKCCTRVTEGERSHDGWGVHASIAHTELETMHVLKKRHPSLPNTQSRTEVVTLTNYANISDIMFIVNYLY